MINMCIKKRAWVGGTDGKERQTQGCESQRKDCGNLVDLDWHIRDHCLEL